MADDSSDSEANAAMEHELYVGKIFPDQKAATKFLHDLALSQGKRAMIDAKRSGGKTKIYKCTSKTPCTFDVRLQRLRAQSVSGYFISSFVLDHHGCTGYKRPMQRQVTELQVTNSAVSANPKASARSLAEETQSTSGHTVSKRMIYRSRDDILEQKTGNYESDFKKVQPLLRAFCELNPGSHFNFECDEEGRFDIAFLSHPHVALHEVHGQRELGIDGTFMKHKMYKETMLALVGRNGNNNNILLAVSLCKSEDTRNCTWFVQNCQTAGITFRDVPIFSDRGHSLFSALHVGSLGAIVRFCTRHIVGSILAKFKCECPPPKELKELVYRAQGAETSEEFKSILFTLGMTHAKAQKYIEAIQAELRTMHPMAVRDIKMYGWRTTNFVESTNGVALECRSLYPLAFFKHYMHEFKNKAFDSQKDGEKWQSDGRILTPYADDLIKEQQDLISKFSVKPKNTTIAFVRSLGGYQVQYRVDTVNKSCTCSYMKQYGLPCRHYLAVLVEFGQLDSMFEACDPCYPVDNYLKGFDSVDHCKRRVVSLPPEAVVELRADIQVKHRSNRLGLPCELLLDFLQEE